MYIIPTIGLYLRFLFFKIINKPKSIKYLTGQKDNLNCADQHFVNWFVGLLFVGVMACFLYIF